MDIALSCWEILVDMAPYVLLGFLVAGALWVLVPQSLVRRHLGSSRRLGPVFKAALVGIPIPLCCCGVIPLAASLRRQGAGRAAVTSFLISTPQTGADSILVTYSLLGPVFAVLRPIAALISGLIGGALVLAWPEKTAAAPPATAGCGCGAPAAAGDGPRLLGALRYARDELPEDLARPFLLGVIGAGAMAALLPPDFFSGFLGGGVLPMLVMLVVGAPLYICATAAVPIAAALLAKGLSPGAALVFLMAAPATNLASIATVWRVMGPRTLVSYLGAVFVTALGAGLALDAFWPGGGVLPAAAGFSEALGPLGQASAVVLVLLLAWGLLRSFGLHGRSEPGST